MSTTNADEEGFLIPIPKRSLGEFIAGLLGQRREITNIITEKNFFIDFSWLTNLDDIILGRVAAQNDSKLVDFTARIYFDDGKIVTLTTHESFRTFRDLSATLTVGIDITWHFLIAFPGRGIPEKQEIRFYGFTNSLFRGGRPQKFRRPFLVTLFRRRREELVFSVSFSDLTWGEDLVAQITRYVDSTLPDYGLMNRALQYLDPFILTLLLVLLTLALVALSILPNSDRAGMMDILHGASGIQGQTLEAVSQKLDLLINLESLRNSRTLGWTTFKPLYILLISMGLFISLALHKASFIALNSFSERYYQDKSKSYELLKYGVGLALLVGIVGGVFSSKLFEFMKVAGLL